MRTNDLRFIEEEHSYWMGCNRIPSVTQMIGAVYPSPNQQYYTEDSRQRGKAVHHATRLIDCGTLDYSTVHERIIGYVKAYERAKRELQIVVKPEDCEFMIYHKELNFCGTPDKVGAVGGFPNKLIDIKTGAPQDNDLLQTAGYIVGLEDTKYTATDRVIIYLNKNGTYKVDWCNDIGNITDVPDFISVLQTFKRGVQNGSYKI